MKDECRSEDQYRALESNMKNSREKAQEALEQDSHFAAFALFRGHSVGANWPGESSQSNWVKAGLPAVAQNPQCFRGNSYRGEGGSNHAQNVKLS
jgi:hypothetical protein